MDSAGAAKRDSLMSQITRAPALMKGLRGRPRSNSSCTSELNGCPDGSWPRRCQISSPECWIACTRLNTLEMLWIENSSAASPAVYRLPSTPITAMPRRAAGTSASAGM